MVIRILLCGFCLFGITVHAQSNTEVYLSSMEFSEEGFVFGNLQNSSNNEGYDNQPYFANDDLLLYARNQDGQTDIAMYDLNKKTTQFFNPPTVGGEYSPQPIPGSRDVAAVRLDPDGTQKLYRYGFEVAPKILIDDKVAYFTVPNDTLIVASVIDLDQLKLVVYDVKNQNSYTLLKDSGRFLQKIPGSDAISYSAKNEQGYEDLYQLDLQTLDSYFICQLPIGVQDGAWWDDYKIIVGSGAQLFVYDLYGDGDWHAIADFSSHGITNITRLAISPDKKNLALVAEKKSSK
ncbi:MAG TPA: hypothetical protein PKW08_11300 [Flavobacteriaceae bacterium]|nr:hypothetical protein [Flavobacteriaceae bacterium]MCB9213761.1 hypothetical protein [Alteromonas sp.]HPF11322.1 hypothetical protein [Flavobacteriaceae bacterium]HQU22163.1 hypothetical protein [Flavobacteriaceae bacterium]HQU64459.1 hypothetical protein [Flavobacteriaceae bacterium]